MESSLKDCTTKNKIEFYDIRNVLTDREKGMMLWESTYFYIPDLLGCPSYEGIYSATGHYLPF